MSNNNNQPFSMLDLARVRLFAQPISHVPQGPCFLDKQHSVFQSTALAGFGSTYTKNRTNSFITIGLKSTPNTKMTPFKNLPFHLQ